MHGVTPIEAMQSMDVCVVFQIKNRKFHRPTSMYQEQ